MLFVCVHCTDSTKQETLVILTSSTLLQDVIMTSYCCQRYRVSGNNFVPAGQRTGTVCRARATVELLRQEMLNFLVPKLLSKQPRSQSCGLQDLGCHAASCRPQTNPSVDEVKRRLIDVCGGLQQSVFNEGIDQWRSRKNSSVCSC